MGYIIMQSDNSQEFVKALRHLVAKGECLFELSLDGPRLYPVVLVSWSDLPYKVYCHSFVVEIPCDRWIITHNRRYIWGKHFYWIYDCNTIKAILEYIGSIYQLRRWSQELFFYDFSIIHHPAKMMKDVDACFHHINALIYRYRFSAYFMRCRDIISRPYAYSYGVFYHCSNSHHIKAPSTSLIETSSSITFLPTLHHSPIRFIQPPYLFCILTQPLTTPSIFITLQTITWFSFDSLISSFGSLFHPCPSGTVTRFF